MKSFRCPCCNQALETGEQGKGTGEECPHCGELLDVSPNKAVIPGDSTLQTEQDGAELLSEEHARKTPPQSGGNIFRKYLKKIVSTGPLTLFSIICTGIFFLLVVMTACFIYICALGFTSLFLLETLGYGTTIYFSKVGVLCAFTGIIFGHLAYYKARKASFFPTRRRFFALVTVANYVVLVSLLGIIHVNESIARSRHVSRKVSCQNRLRQTGTIFSFYADEHDSLPPLLSSGKRLVYEYETADATWISRVFPSSLISHFCPHDKQGNGFLNNWIKDGNKATPTDFQEVINKSSYMYLGYAVTNDEEMHAFSEAYKERLAQGLPFDTDLEVPPGKGTNGGDTIFRLKKISRGISSEEKREEIPRIPVIWDRCLLAPGEHEPTLFHDPKGINVLFLNGLVEFIPYGENRWPLTEETMRMFWELENL